MSLCFHDDFEAEAAAPLPKETQQILRGEDIKGTCMNMARRDDGSHAVISVSLYLSIYLSVCI